MGVSVSLRTRALFVFLSWMFVGQMVADPQYFVTVPAVLEAGAETKFCMSLLQPDELLVINVTLNSADEETTLLKITSSEEFHRCFTFQAPELLSELLNFKVVVHGDKFDSEEVRRVWIQAFTPMTFIQTDKPYYLPGQTVYFRVVSLDSMFRPASRLYSTIQIEDSMGRLLGQWLNYTSDEKILQLSFPLSSRAHEGKYKISVWVSGRRIYREFTVHNYALSKFKVIVKASDKISVGRFEIPVEVCAIYTFAQPVPASVKLKMCRPLDPDLSLDTPCYTETKQTGKNGCAMFNVEMATFTKLDPQAMQDKLEIKAKVEELGTGISKSRVKNMKLSYSVGKLLFIDTPTFFNQGSIVEGKVKAVNFNNEPVPNKMVHLWIKNLALPQNLTTDSRGDATFTLNTTNQDNIQLRANPKPDPGQNHHSKTPYFEGAQHTLSLVMPPSPRPKSFSSLKVKRKEKQLSCNEEESFSISYTLVGETRAAVDVLYLILSRGNIVRQGHQKTDVPNQSVTEGEISFTLKVTPDLSPEFQLVAYTVLSNEIVIADSENFSTEKCFSNKVSLEFSPSPAVPGEEVTLKVSADPGSLCGVSAVDQSVLIEEPGKNLDTEKIFKLLPVKTASYNPDDDDNTCLKVEPGRSKYRHRRDSSGSWGFPVFKRVGLKMVTNMFTKLPSCLNFKGKMYYDESHCGLRIVHLSDRLGITTQDTLPAFKIRTFFPETWIWNMVDVGDSGSTDLSLTVPDTITTWETEAFCLSPLGFGLAPIKTLTVFHSFFLELSLPYSTIRGEQFALKATVFNYLPSCVMVTVSPAHSSDYTLTPLPGEQYTSCLCTNDQQTFSWTMSPSVLGSVNVTVSAEAVASKVSCDNKIVSVPVRGRMDVVTKSLIVKAEGTEQTKTYNWLLCPNGGTLTEEVELQLPENVITGSARATLTVLGDTLGRGLRNFDGLLKMPHESGEQNMALMASNIYILEYLMNTQQLTPAIQEKAINFLTNGYRKQLNYKHKDGAYSMFVKGERNAWLTAFVLKSFVKASSFIFIDSANVAQSITWLLRKQQRNGCFELSGKLFNNEMKGGVSDEVTLSAYITATFLEVNTSLTHPVTQGGLSCLKESISYMNNTYTTALLAYVFTLAGDMETRALLLRNLDTVAINQGGALHWSQKGEVTPLSVEISSYVLLAKLSASPTAEDLAYSARIVKWLTGQQNEYGGFSSSQDTVVALQALALYSTKVFSHEGSSTVMVQSPSDRHTFDVNPNNRLLYQEAALKDTTGKYSLEVKGAACATVQISLHYNIPILPQNTTVYMEAQSESLCIGLPHRFNLKLKSEHRGYDTDTNMVIMEIKLLTGFLPDLGSLTQIKENYLVDHVDHKNDLVVVHLKELPKNFLVWHIALIMEMPVQNLKPGFVKIYDLYEPSCHVEMEYSDPCAAGNTG